MIVIYVLDITQYDLQGASRTTGGLFQGRAYGNNPNIVDLADQDHSLIPIIGKVYIYTTANDPITWDFTKMKHQFGIKLQVTSSLATVFNEIGDRHSPVSLWTQWGLFFIHLSDESEFSTYKGMNSEGMKIG